jgi:hypothetical protein
VQNLSAVGWAQVNVGLNTSAVATGLSLVPGQRYAVRCTATNNAGLSDFADSPPLVHRPWHAPSETVCVPVLLLLWPALP